MDAGKVITVLNHKITKLDNEKLDRDLIMRKEDFSRKAKKISFSDDIKIILGMGAQSIRKEMYKYYNYDPNTVTSSGFVQSRAKIKDKTYKELMDLVNKAYPCKNTYKGYRLLACDGSDIAISPDINDFETNRPNRENAAVATNLIKINALYDILNNRYIDAIIQGQHFENENLALQEMVERYNGGKTIIIADRGYSSFNTFEHIRHTGNYFLIRIKDLETKASLLNRFVGAPKGGEFDVDLTTIFTRLQINETKKDRKYRILMKNQKFDYVDKDNKFYEATYRVVRIRINGKKEEYESIITNLPRDKFTTKDIEELYKLRWCIETSFKHLKYSVGLSALHSKRRDFIRQEILARLVMYNIASIIIEEIRIKRLDKKYEYKINITLAIFLIKEQCIKRKGVPPPNLIEMIASNILPIRKGRSYKRNVKPQGYTPFGYRF